jgi:hypothetical protein
MKISKPDNTPEDISESDSHEPLDRKPKLPRYHSILKPLKKVQKHISSEVAEVVQIDREESSIPLA